MELNQPFSLPAAVGGCDLIGSRIQCGMIGAENVNLRVSAHPPGTAPVHGGQTTDHTCPRSPATAAASRSQKSSCFPIVAIILCFSFASSAVVGMVTACA